LDNLYFEDLSANMLLYILGIYILASHLCCTITLFILENFETKVCMCVYIYIQNYILKVVITLSGSTFVLYVMQLVLIT